MTDIINETIDQSIDSLVNESPEKSAAALSELANLWARAGMPLSSFLDMRKFIINQATERTSAFFIKEKLEAQEQILRKERNDSRKIIIH